MREFVLGIAIDPNPTVTGISYWRGREPFRWLPLEPLEQPESAPSWNRMVLAIWRVLLTNKPDWVAVEETYEGPNKKINQEMNRIVGSIISYCTFRLYPVYPLHTATIDSLVGIPHKGRKVHTKALAEKLIGQKIKSQDIADSLIVGMAAVEIRNQEKVLADYV